MQPNGHDTPPCRGRLPSGSLSTTATTIVADQAHSARVGVMARVRVNSKVMVRVEVMARLGLGLELMASSGLGLEVGLGLRLGCMPN